MTFQLLDLFERLGDLADDRHLAVRLATLSPFLETSHALSSRITVNYYRGVLTTKFLFNTPFGVSASAETGILTSVIGEEQGCRDSRTSSRNSRPRFRM